MSTNDERVRGPGIRRFRTQYSNPDHDFIVMIVGILFTLLGVFTIIYILFIAPDAVKPLGAKYLLIAWVFLPPLAFWAEYWLVWRFDPCCEEKDSLERFKYAQELGKNVWLAFVILLAAFYFGGELPIPKAGPPAAGATETPH
jgi:hypothetical protein